MSAEKRAYTLDELSEQNLGGKTFLYGQIKAGKLIATKVGRKTVVLHEHRESYIASLPQREASH